MAKEIDVKKETQERTPSVLDALDEMDRLTESFLANPFGNWMQDLSPKRMPRRAVSQIRETDDGYLFSAELPGVPREDIHIDVSGNLLTVKAEQSSEKKEESRFRREYRSFYQSFTLPSSVDPEKIEAQYENGLLEVMIPKTEKAQAKRIEVQSGRGGFLKSSSQQKQTAH